MNTPFSIIFSALCMLWCQTLMATPIYKYVDEQGVVTYSDTPQPGSVEVQIKPIQQYSAPKLSESQNAKLPDLPLLQTPPDITYTALTVKEPKAGDVFDSGTETITVTGTVSPELATQHLVQLTLDGAPLGTPEHTLVFSLPHLERGDHTVSLAIIDPNALDTPLITSNTVKFFQFRVSQNFQNQQPQRNQISAPPAAH